MNKVLIFDDDTDILELCSIILSRKGFEVTMATTCESIIEKVMHTNPDVILMDNWLPDIGGVRATQLLKKNQNTRHIPVVFFSANNQTESFSHEAGAEYFIQKPFDIDELVRVVQKAAESKPENLPVSYIG